MKYRTKSQISGDNPPTSGGLPDGANSSELLEALSKYTQHLYEFTLACLFIMPTFSYPQTTTLCSVNTYDAPCQRDGPVFFKIPYPSVGLALLYIAYGPIEARAPFPLCSDLVRRRWCFRSTGVNYDRKSRRSILRVRPYSPSCGLP